MGLAASLDPPYAGVAGAGVTFAAIHQSRPPPRITETHSGTCWANAAARAVLSVLVRVYGHPEGTCDPLSSERIYWDMVDFLVRNGHSNGFSGENGTGGWPHKAVAFLKDRRYPFLTCEKTRLCDRDKWESVMYERWALPGCHILTCKVNGSRLTAMAKITVDDLSDVRNWETGHAMSLVGVAYDDDDIANAKYYWVLLNSWGSSAHHGGQGFVLLQDNPVLLEAMNVQVYIVGYNKENSSYDEYRHQWNSALRWDRMEWLQARISTHNHHLRHLPGIRKFEFKESALYDSEVAPRLSYVPLFSRLMPSMPLMDLPQDRHFDF